MLRELLIVSFLELFHNARSFSFPFIPIQLRVIEVFVTGHTKDTTGVQLFGQGNNVKVVEANLTLVPALCGVSFGTARLEGMVQLFKELFIPMQINLPMLHGMGDIRSLNQVCK